MKTSIVSSQDVYNIANLTIVPGVAYQDVGIRLLKIENKDLDFVSLEPCCGTHAKNTSELQDISITACKKVGRRSHEFTAVCGPLDFQVEIHCIYALYHVSSKLILGQEPRKSTIGRIGCSKKRNKR